MFLIHAHARSPLGNICLRSISSICLCFYEILEWKNRKYSMAMNMNLKLYKFSAMLVFSIHDEMKECLNHWVDLNHLELNDKPQS